MRLVVYEWRKLLRLPALWVFLGLCLAFNGLLMGTLSPYDRAFFNDTSADAAALGQRVDGDFLEGLSALPETENRTLLLQSVTGLEDIFETYDTGVLSDFYAGVVERSPLAVDWMTWKYSLLAGRVEHLARIDAALDLYAGPATHGSHQFLFGTLFRAILGESAILAMLGTESYRGPDLFLPDRAAAAAGQGAGGPPGVGGTVWSAGPLHPGALFHAL